MKHISHHLLFWLGNWMIHSSPVCSPGALTQEGKCFSINYLDEAGLRAEGERFRREAVRILQHFDSTMRHWRVAICVLNQSKDESNYGQRGLWCAHFKPAVTSVFLWWSTPHSRGINQILAKGRNFRFVLFYLPVSGIFFPPVCFIWGYCLVLENT